MNSFGYIYRLTTFGESHGPATGGVIDGMPAGMSIDFDALNLAMERRRPGQSQLTTSRKEADEVKFLSGLLDGVTTGTPIGFVIRNTDARSESYDNLKNAFRPSHADYTYEIKYGLRDHRGGGRASARETVTRVVAGELARQVLEKYGIKIYGYTSQIGDIALPLPYTSYNLDNAKLNDVRCPDNHIARQMAQSIINVKNDGNSVGGVVSCVVTGMPIGIGEPTFGKLQSHLAGAMLSIGAAKGFEYGMGFEGCRHFGSEMIDEFTTDDAGRVHTITNHSGGIQGGISNGEDIYFNVAFKPVATLLRDVNTIDSTGKPIVLKSHGRHDPCVVPRAVAVVEAMTAMVLLDQILISRTTRL